jgi:hypothetical protein
MKQFSFPTLYGLDTENPMLNNFLKTGRERERERGEKLGRKVRDTTFKVGGGEFLCFKVPN